MIALIDRYGKNSRQHDNCTTWVMKKEEPKPAKKGWWPF